MNKTHQKVLEIFTHEMKHCGYEPSTIQRAQRLWNDWIHAQPPAVRKPEVYAATVEYTTSTLYAIPTTQREVATRYNVSISSVRRAHRTVKALLNLTLGDPLEPSQDQRRIDHLLQSLDQASHPLGDEVSSKALFHILQTAASTQPRHNTSPIHLSLRQQHTALSLPLLDTEWIGLRHTLDPLPQTPPCDLALWVRCDTETILGYNIIPSNAPDSVFVSHLLDTMESPLQDPPHRPKHLTICNATVAQRLSSSFSLLDIHIQHSPTTPLLQRFLQHTQDLLSNAARAPHETLFPTHNPSGLHTTRAFFQAAHDALQLDLWGSISPDTWVAIDLHAHSLERPCITLPSPHTIHIFDSIQSATTAHNARSLALSLNTPSPVAQTAAHATPHIALVFEPIHNLHPDDRKTILRHSLPLHSHSLCPVPTSHHDLSPLHALGALTTALEVLNALRTQNILSQTPPDVPHPISNLHTTSHPQPLSAFVLHANHTH